MSLYKRKDSPYWWIKFNVNGRRLQRSTGTADKQKAQEYHDKVRVQLWDETRLGIKPRHTWKEAVVRYVRETSHKATHKVDLMHLRWLNSFLGHLALNAINRDELDRIQDKRKAEGISNASVNRTMEVVRSILRRACYDWEWLDRVPKVRMLPESKRRVRWLTQDEAERLMAELPAHLAAMVRFTLETGLRQRNVTQLEWSQMDTARRCAWVHPDQAKARKAIPVPLTATALFVLRQQQGKHAQFVFTFRGEPVRWVSGKTWRDAVKRAGLKDFRWHDLRHTWASWHVQAGTPMYVLQELGGWSSAEMVRRYAHLSSEHLAQYAERMSNRSQGSTIQLREEPSQAVAIS